MVSLDRSRRVSLAHPAAARCGGACSASAASGLGALLLYLAAAAVLYLDGAAQSPASLLAALGQAPGAPALKAAFGALEGAAAAWDMALVVPSTAGGAREAQALYAASLAATSWSASLLVVQGSAGGGGGGGGAAGGGGGGGAVVESSLGGRVVRLAVACPDASAIPAVSVAWHADSHFTCKVLEGLCAAAGQGGGGPLPRFVAVVAEGAVFRWAEFLRARAPALLRAPGAGPGLVVTHVTEEWTHGLPEAYRASKSAWPRMPLWNSSVVLSGALAGKLCRLHAGRPLDLHGPPEMQLGMLLSTLEGVTWVHEPAGEAPASGGGCPEGLTVTKMTKAAFAACQAKAALAGDAF